jgi:hypothetical protein
MAKNAIRLLRLVGASRPFALAATVAASLSHAGPAFADSADGGADGGPAGPFVHEDRLDVKGAADYPAATVDAVIQRRFAAVAECYAPEMKTDPHRQVTIGLTFVITRRGTMSRLEGAGDTSQPAAPTQAQELACTVNSFSGMEFPPPSDAVHVSASFTVSNDR